MFYYAGLKLYSTAIKIASFRNPKAKQWVDGRKGLFENMKRVISTEDNLVWFHCASLGEFEQGRPLLEKLRERKPEYKILVTFFSPSGYEIRKNYPLAEYVFYLPIDTKSNVRRFLDIVNPKIAIFIKYEFWPNFLSELHKRDIPTYVVSAIFRQSQSFFKWYGGFFRDNLRKITHIFVQDDNSLSLLKGIGIDNATICGDTRFDRVFDISKATKSIDSIKLFSEASDTFIAGSTWEKDDEIIVALAEKFPKIKFIVAPHELGESKIEALVNTLKEIGRKPIRYTISKGVDTSQYDVMIIDVIGILSSVYQYGKYGYIGGGFGVGIHNTLEAATFGLPLMFGPNYKKFREAVKLIEIGSAVSISSKDEAINQLDTLSSNEPLRTEAANKARNYVKTNIGACEKILNIVL